MAFLPRFIIRCRSTISFRFEMLPLRTMQYTIRTMVHSLFPSLGELDSISRERERECLIEIKREKESAEVFKW